MARVARRGFLKAAVAALLLGIGVLASRAWWRRRSAGVGDLANGVLESCRLAALAVVGLPLRFEHYEALFRWRARDPRYAELYRTLAGALDARARAQRSRSFRELSEEERGGVTRSVLATETPVGELGFDAHFAQEVLRLYARTDAWLELGYEDWPFTARGLDYASAPGSAARGS